MRGVVDVLDYLPYLEVWNHARFLKKLRSSPILAHGEDTPNEFVSALRLPPPAQSKKRNEPVPGEVRRFDATRRLRRHTPRQAIHAI